jgi:hypothetical protein
MPRRVSSVDAVEALGLCVACEVIIDGWGQQLPEQLWPELATHITELVHHTEAITATT